MSAIPLMVISHAAATVSKYTTVARAASTISARPPIRDGPALPLSVPGPNLESRTVLHYKLRLIQ
jgi:hypothetical protein